MPRVPIAEEYKTGEGGDRFPSIKLNDKGDKRRFTVIETPWREWVHILKAPMFDDDGTPVKETRKRRDDSEYSANKLEFVSMPICLGDEQTLREQGIDEKNCPACEASARSGGDIPGPVQRFAVNVVVYDLRGNTFDLKDPFGASIQIWKFSGRVYDEIQGIQAEIGDLRKHDITLECEDPYWQRNKLAFKTNPGYAQAPEGYIRKLVTGPGNKATDDQLRDACGRAVARSRMQDDADFCSRQFRRLANDGGTHADAAVTGPADLSEGIMALLEGDEVVQQGAPLAAGTEADPFAEFQPDKAAADRELTDKEKASVAVAEAAVTTAAVKQEQAAKEKEEAGDFDFEDLLRGL